MLETINFQYLPLKPNTEILDLGCGEGRHTLSLIQQYDCHCIGVDQNQNSLDTALERYESDMTPIGKASFIRGDAYSLPFPDNHFDIVICSEVLEHLEHYTDCLTEMKRVLKPNGTLAISVPSYFPEWICWKLSSEYHSVEGGHIRIFNAKELKTDITLYTGRYCYQSHKSHALHSPYWWLKCLLWNQDKHFLIDYYHQFLLWDLFKRPKFTQILDTVLNPIIGKSIVMYFK